MESWLHPTLLHQVSLRAFESRATDLKDDINKRREIVMGLPPTPHGIDTQSLVISSPALRCRCIGRERLKKCPT